MLASGSPRRRELLARLVPAFQVLSSPVEEQGDESTPGWELGPLPLPQPFMVQPHSDPRLWAWRKAADVAGQRRAHLPEGTLVLGADTIVVAPGEILGKPGSAHEARKMLYVLRGQEHYVVTGFALLRVELEKTTTLQHEAVVAKVAMRDFSEGEIEEYLATGESMDKAGAYALQGLGGRLVERVEGCRATVIGLPVCRVRAALQSAGAALLPYPPGGYCQFCQESGNRAR